MRRKLNECLDVLSWVIDYLFAVRSDVKFNNNQGKIFYAVDFSEIHSFINPENQDELSEIMGKREIGFGFGASDISSAVSNYRIGLFYLFTKLENKVFLLPPHSNETWNYINRQKYMCDRMDIVREDLYKKTLKIPSTPFIHQPP